MKARPVIKTTDEMTEAWDSLGVRLSDLKRFKSDSSVWSLCVNGKGLLLHTRQLLNQTQFRTRCMAELGILPNRVKPKGWDWIIKKLLKGGDNP